MPDDVIQIVLFRYGVIIVVAALGIVAARAWQVNRKRNEIEAKREALAMENESKDQRSQNTKPDIPTLDEGVDALDLLRQIERQETGEVQQVSDGESEQAATDHIDTDDTANQQDDDVDLASLIAGIEDDPDSKPTNTKSIPVNLASGDVTTAEQVISILRDDETGKLLILIDGVAYASFDGYAGRKSDVLAIFKELSNTVMKSKPKAAAKPTSQRQPKPAQQSVDDKDNEEDDDVSVLIKAAQELDGEEERLPGDLPTMTLDSLPESYEEGRFGLRKINKPQKVEQVNIADAIEAYLQFKIERTPKFQRRGIHVRPDITGGVRIEADGKRFTSVNDVDDTEVKKFLQDTIAEWQERNQRR